MTITYTRLPSPPRRLAPTRSGAHLALLAVVAGLTLISARPARAEENLLEGKRPSSSSGVGNVRALTDGVGAYEGEEWNTSVAAIDRKSVV